MLGREETWFHKNRGFILGFSVVIVVLNIALFLLVPLEKVVSIDAAAPEFSAVDEAFRTEHTVQLDGTIISRSFQPDTFEGTLCVDGASAGLNGTRENGVWKFTWDGAQNDQILDLRGDRELTNLVILFSAEADGIRFLSVRADNRTAALHQRNEYYPELAK